MVISKFGMRSDIQSYNLGGMGCSASLISIDLAKNMLQRRSTGGIALVVSTETITPNLYHGNERGEALRCHYYERCLFIRRYFILTRRFAPRRFPPAEHALQVRRRGHGPVEQND